MLQCGTIGASGEWRVKKLSISGGDYRCLLNAEKMAIVKQWAGIGARNMIPWCLSPFASVFFPGLSPLLRSPECLTSFFFFEMAAVVRVIRVMLLKGIVYFFLPCWYFHTWELSKHHNMVLPDIMPDSPPPYFLAHISFQVGGFDHVPATTFISFGVLLALYWTKCMWLWDNAVLPLFVLGCVKNSNVTVLAELGHCVCVCLSALYAGRSGHSCVP